MNQPIPVTGKTRVYGILGFPVTHSLSPCMQNAAMQAAGIDGIYVPFSVSPAELADAVAGLRALQLQGVNVTIPHKSVIMPLLDELAPSAREAAAVNTVVWSSGRLVGHNTDGDGLVVSLGRDLGVTLPGKAVLLVGAGGAACGALPALCRAGVRSVLVVNRTLPAAEALVRRCAELYPATELHCCGFDGLDAGLLGGVDLLINATSRGMAGEKIEGLSLAHLPDHARVYDMVYAPVPTPLLEEARRCGLSAVDGRGMLVAQGERAFCLWHGQEPPSGVMGAALANLLQGVAKP